MDGGAAADAGPELRHQNCRQERPAPAWTVFSSSGGHQQSDPARGTDLPLNGIGLVDLTFDEPLVLDPYQQNPVTGGLIFIDRLTNVTVGAGMVREPLSAARSQAGEFSAFELELNALVRKHFPHWGARDLLGGK